MNFFDHKDLGNHLLQLCPKVLKHPVYVYYSVYCRSVGILQLIESCTCITKYIVYTHVYYRLYFISARIVQLVL